MPATQDIGEAAEAVLAAHLQALLRTAGWNTLRAVPGWPEHKEDGDLSLGPLLSVHVVRADSQQHGAMLVAELDHPTDEDLAIGLYDVGSWSGTIQLTLWATHKKTLQEISLPLREAMLPDPDSVGLNLVMSTYYGAILGLDDDIVERPPQSETENQRGEFVMRWDVKVTSRLLRERTKPRQLVIQVDQTLQDTLGGTTWTRPYEVT
jgi:hypothetical protein